MFAPRPQKFSPPRHRPACEPTYHGFPDRFAEPDRSEVIASQQLEREFLSEFGVREFKWSGHNVSMLLRSTGETPDRIDEACRLLQALGMGCDCRRWPSQHTGVFDHGRIYGRDGKPWAIVGHPYQVDANERSLLQQLARSFPTLKVAVDDRPSFYGFGSHHVRIEAGPAPANATRPARRPLGSVVVNEGPPAAHLHGHDVSCIVPRDVMLDILGLGGAQPEGGF